MPETAQEFDGAPPNSTPPVDAAPPADAPCTLSTDSTGFTLRFAEPQWAVTPGQSAVLYDGEVCLGGGVIHTEAANAPA